MIKTLIIVPKIIRIFFLRTIASLKKLNQSFAIFFDSTYSVVVDDDKFDTTYASPAIDKNCYTELKKKVFSFIRYILMLLHFYIIF